MRTHVILLTLVSVAAVLSPGVPTGVANDATMTQSPKDCFASYLNGYWEYQMVPGVKDRWDGWSAETRGFCYYANGEAVRCDTTGHAAPCCNYSEPRVNAPSDHPRNALCWWGAKEEPMTPALQFNLGLDAIRGLATAALDVPDICSLLGTGTVKIRVVIGATLIGLVSIDCAVSSIGYITPPANCKVVDPKSYDYYQRYQFVRDRWDAYSANSASACSWKSNPRITECKFWDGAQQGSSAGNNAVLEVICWFGEAGIKIQSDHADFPGQGYDYTIRTTPDFVRSLINSGDQGALVKTGIQRGFLVLEVGDTFKKMAINAALAGWVGDLGPTVQVGVGQSILLGGQDVVLESLHDRSDIFQAPLDGVVYVVDGLGSPLGALPSQWNRYSSYPAAILGDLPGFDANAPDGILLAPPDWLAEYETNQRSYLQVDLPELRLFDLSGIQGEPSLLQGANSAMDAHGALSGMDVGVGS